jgi:hypothetical protein
VQIKVHVEELVLTPAAAMHRARAWLAAHVGEQLGVATPELVIEDGLTWRFDVTFARPNEAQPGSGALYHLGQIRLEAMSGDVIDREALAADLRVHVASLAP